MHTTRLAAVTLLLSGCLNARPPLPPPPTTPAVQVPSEKEVTELEVKFSGGNGSIRIITDRKTIQEFLAFVQSLDTGWVKDVNIRQSGGIDWQIVVRQSGGADTVYLFGGGILSCGGSERWQETVRQRELNRDQTEQIALILDFKHDLREAGIERFAP